MDPRTQVTQTLKQARKGSGGGAETLMPVVYEELRAMARRWFRDQPQNASLQPTALVHEAYLHLVDQAAADWKDRAHFAAVASIAMRQILIQRARRRRTLKRGGAWKRVTLGEPGSEPLEGVDDLLALDEALSKLAGLHERHARVVELRFFGGLEVREVAVVLEVSERTVESDWRAAKAWLRTELADHSE